MVLSDHLGSLGLPFICPALSLARSWEESPAIFLSIRFRMEKVVGEDLKCGHRARRFLSVRICAASCWAGVPGPALPYISSNVCSFGVTPFSRSYRVVRESSLFIKEFIA